MQSLLWPPSHVGPEFCVWENVGRSVELLRIFFRDCFLLVYRFFCFIGRFFIFTFSQFQQSSRGGFSWSMALQALHFHQPTWQLVLWCLWQRSGVFLLSFQKVVCGCSCNCLCSRCIVCFLDFFPRQNWVLTWPLPNWDMKGTNPDPYVASRECLNYVGGRAARKISLKISCMKFQFTISQYFHCMKMSFWPWMKPKNPKMKVDPLLKGSKVIPTGILLFFCFFSLSLPSFLHKTKPNHAETFGRFSKVNDKTPQFTSLNESPFWINWLAPNS